MAVTITEFLLARITEDEEVARGATLGPWEVVPMGEQPRVQQVGHDAWLALTSSDPGAAKDANAQHIARHDPARVLAECAAKRAIMSHFVETVKWSRDPDCPAAQSYSDIAVGLGESLRHLAAVYADHPDYRQEWAA